MLHVREHEILHGAARSYVARPPARWQISLRAASQWLARQVRRSLTSACTSTSSSLRAPADPADPHSESSPRPSGSLLRRME